MGSAWDCGAFDNDTACDWSEELDDCDDLSVIEKSLDDVIDCGDEYLEADEGVRGLAACEAIARLRGRFGVRNSYTETVDKWAAAHQALDCSPLLERARRVLDRIAAEDSELAESWRDSDSFDRWTACVEGLRARLT